MLNIWKTSKSADQQVFLSKKVLLTALHVEIVRGTEESGVRALIK